MARPDRERERVRHGKASQVRCAVYTRKSTEEGLDQDFNSLDAQREACEAFIQSQKSEGWVLVPDSSTMTTDEVLARLAERGLALPNAPAPAGSYVALRIHGEVGYLAFDQHFAAGAWCGKQQRADKLAGFRGPEGNSFSAKAICIYANRREAVFAEVCNPTKESPHLSA